MANYLDSQEDTPTPEGQLQLKVVALPKHTNLHGDISASWVLNQMEQAAELEATQLAKGRVATVAVSATDFLCPVSLGSQVEVYSSLLSKGTSSIKLACEVWLAPTKAGAQERYKVAEAEFVMVALDQEGRIRSLP